MVEFAFVLIWREANDGQSIAKEESESEKVVSGTMTKQPNTITKISPVEVINGDLKEKRFTEKRQTIFQGNAHNFFGNLTFARKIDFPSFLIYNFTYFLFNLIYFVICMSNNDNLE